MTSWQASPPYFSSGRLSRSRPPPAPSPRMPAVRRTRWEALPLFHPVKASLFKKRGPGFSLSTFTDRLSRRLQEQRALLGDSALQPGIIFPQPLRHRMPPYHRWCRWAHTRRSSRKQSLPLPSDRDVAETAAHRPFCIERSAFDSELFSCREFRRCGSRTGCTLRPATGW